MVSYLYCPLGGVAVWHGCELWPESWAYTFKHVHENESVWFVPGTLKD